MISIALVGVLLTIGIPALRNWILNTQIKTAAESINNGLQLARGEAVRRNTNVQFTLGVGSSWNVGCVTAQGDDDGDGVDDCPATIQSRASGETASAVVSVTPGGATMVTFNGLGRVATNIDASAPITEIEIDIADSVMDPAESRELRVMVAGGSVRMCDPSATRAGDPRICP
ncbi:MAG TPA: prepilin-type cleavage/methylation domain-containing protein [Planctomycetaceae bacterium]|nr:prepilin-type cleavage/methylation domain-containing protein [Planctomycetaceae bacterium]